MKKYGDIKSFITHDRLPVFLVQLLLLFLLLFCSSSNSNSIHGAEVEFFNYRLGNEFQVNSNTIANNQQSPAIASFTNDGDFIIVWTSIQTNNNSDIYFQRFDSNGTRRGTEVKVNSSIWNKNNDNPTIAVVKTGAFSVAWDVVQYNVFTGYSPTGGTVRNDHKVSYTNAGIKRNTAVAVSLTNNRYLFTWETTIRDGVSYDIYASQWLDNGGAPHATDTPVNTYTAGDQTNADTCSLSDGGYVIVWQSAGQDGDGTGIYARRVSELRQPLGSSEFQVNTRTAGNQTSPAIAGLSGGGFVVVWQSNIHDEQDGIFGQRYDSSGVRQGSEFQVNTFTIGDQTNPDVASVSDGGFVVTWQSNNQDGDGLGIYAQRYDAIGSKMGREFQVNTDSTGNEQLPVVTGLKDGKFVISWQSATGPYAQIFEGVWRTSSELNQQTLTVYQGDTIILDGTLLSASDGLVDNNTLLFVISNVENCQFERVAQPGISITNFTQQEVVLGDIQLVHDGGFHAPSYQMSVNNGYLSTTPENATIYFILTVESTLNQQPLTVYQGETIVLNSTLLSASDSLIDNNTLLFMVSNVENCQFERVAQPGIAITNFTQQEVIAEEIQLVHDDSIKAPSYKMSVSNGFLSTTPQEATIYFSLVPWLVIIQLSIRQGETIVLGSSHFQVSYRDASPGELVYTVSQVQHGRFELASVPNTVITEFSQLQINKGEIQFVHDRSRENPSFIAWVNNGQYQSPEHTVNVSLVLTTSNHRNGAIIGGVVGGVGGCLALTCCVTITVAFIGLCLVKNKKKEPTKQVDLEKGIEMVG